MLDELRGDRLSSVEFVADYVQLHFDGSSLTCFVWPSVEVGPGDVRTFGDAGYRDALCAFITHEVTGVEESEVAGLTLRFGPGSLVVNPALEELVGPEIAMVQVPGDSRWAVWRPGEPPFERLGG